MNPFLTSAPEQLDWHERALCVGDPELFFDPQRVAKAITVCRSCPVLLPCREAARRHGEKVGIWGGELRGSRAKTA